MDDAPVESSSQPDNEELPYQSQANVTPWPLPHWSTFHSKTDLVRQIRDIYLNGGRLPEENLNPEGMPREFKSWQAALFYMLPEQALRDLVQYPEEVKLLGDHAKIFGTRLVTGRGDVEPKSAAAKQAKAALSAREEERRTEAIELAQDASAAADQAPSSCNPPTSSSAPETSRVPQRSSSRSSTLATGTLRRMAGIGKRLRRSSSSSSKGKGTLDVSDTEMEPAPAPTTRSKTAAKRARIHELSFEPPATVQETNETEFVQDNQAIETEPAPAGFEVGTRSAAVLNRIKNRDKGMCVVTRIMECTEGAHIIPFTINNTTGALKLLLPILQIAQRLMGTAFTAQIRPLISGVTRSDKIWNIITLVDSLHKYADTKGLIGYRPRFIEPAENGKYNVTFTIHWLTENLVKLWNTCDLSAAFCFCMTRENQVFTEKKAHIVQFDFEGNKIEDGHLVKIPCEQREDAVNMMHMLKFRWEAGIFYCLAGGAGLTYDELEDEEDDEDKDKYFKEYGIHESDETSQYFRPHGS